MVGMMKWMCVTVVAATMLVAWVVPGGEAAITCDTVASSVRPCISYALGNGPPMPPPALCCRGIESLSRAASTQPDRQAVCNCLKSLAGSIRGVNLGKVAGLPGRCGVSIPYKISPSTNCAGVR